MDSSIVGLSKEWCLDRLQGKPYSRLGILVCTLGAGLSIVETLSRVALAILSAVPVGCIALGGIVIDEFSGDAPSWISVAIELYVDNLRAVACPEDGTYVTCKESFVGIFTIALYGIPKRT